MRYCLVYLLTNGFSVLGRVPLHAHPVFYLPDGPQIDLLVSFMRSSTPKPTRPLWLNLLPLGQSCPRDLECDLCHVWSKGNAPLPPNLLPTSFSSPGYAFRLPFPAAMIIVYPLSCLFSWILGLKNRGTKFMDDETPHDECKRKRIPKGE